MRCSVHTFTRIIFANIDYLIYKLLLPLTYSLANFCVVIVITQTDCHLLFINTTNYISIYCIYAHLFYLNISPLS